jgi:ubiquinone/menaquinone biosynthesis C-methylase UbiE
MANAIAGQTLDLEENRGLGEDSTIDSGDSFSATTSVASWVRDYREENGRTYHAYRDGSYFQPNDEKAQENLDIAHHLFLKTFDDKLHLAPLPSTLQNVLDIGTGTGIWAMDFADEHPEAQIVGTDLSPIQPSWAPSNCKFEIDDADTADWTWPDNHFDYIHVRSLFGCVTSWPKFYQEVLRVLKPGGWYEQAEFSLGFTSDDGSVTDDTAMGNWIKHGIKCFEVIGKPILLYETMAADIRAVGFTSVEERKFKWPIGPWPKDRKLKEIGIWTRAHLDAGLEGWTMRGLTTVLGWTPPQVHAFCANMRKEMGNPKIHGIHPMTAVFAQKPAG